MRLFLGQPTPTLGLRPRYVETNYTRRRVNDRREGRAYAQLLCNRPLLSPPNREVIIRATFSCNLSRNNVALKFSPDVLRALPPRFNNICCTKYRSGFYSAHRCCRPALDSSKTRAMIGTARNQTLLCYKKKRKKEKRKKKKEKRKKKKEKRKKKKEKRKKKKEKRKKKKEKRKKKKEKRKKKKEKRKKKKEKRKKKKEKRKKKKRKPWLVLPLWLRGVVIAATRIVSCAAAREPRPGNVGPPTSVSRPRRRLSRLHAVPFFCLSNWDTRAREMRDRARDVRRLCLSLAPVPQLLWTKKERDCVQSRGYQAEGIVTVLELWAASAGVHAVIGPSAARDWQAILFHKLWAILVLVYTFICAWRT